MEDLKFEHGLIVKQVVKIRKIHPRMGGRKMYELLAPFMQDHQIKMGRDALFNLLSMNNLLVKRKKKGIYTTNSFHYLHKYPNLIKDFIAVAPNQLWVSDITYWKLTNGFVYISLITDAFSHKIVGYQLAKTLEATAPTKALQMAIASNPNRVSPLIHHSDRGIQYCCYDYVKVLKENKIIISMTENGDPLQNAIAERVNGILKGEYLECYTVKSFEQANRLLKQTVKLYNEQRPHMSIGNKQPSYIHQENIRTEKLWKNYYSTKNNL